MGTCGISRTHIPDRRCPVSPEVRAPLSPPRHDPGGWVGTTCLCVTQIPCRFCHLLGLSTWFEQVLNRASQTHYSRVDRPEVDRTQADVAVHRVPRPPLLPPVDSLNQEVIAPSLIAPPPGVIAGGLEVLCAEASQTGMGQSRAGRSCLKGTQ